MSNEWYTPSKYIEAAREVIGSIDMDPASCEIANATVQAKEYFSKDNDGLIYPWCGNVWLNPPYSETGKWVDKIVREYCDGGITQAVVAVNVSSDTLWFQELFVGICCLVKGRVNFNNPVRESIRPRFPSAFIYFGPNEEKFVAVFKQFGRIVRAID